jgi:acetolactate synthase I/II/III large subunit
MTNPDAAPKKYSITKDGRSDSVVLIACAEVLAECGGGLFQFDGTCVEQIDRLSTGGMLVHDDRLLRIQATRCAPDFGGEILMYDARGVLKYFRVDNIQDAHYLAWDGENYIIVATWHNRLVWISPAGDVVRSLDFPGEVDSWHLNDVFVKDGRVYVSAFGDSGVHRSWKGPADGFLLDLASGERVLTGLRSPHNPRFFDGRWTICNSAEKQLQQFEAGSSTPVRCLQLNGWTRGLAVSDDYLFVGESAQRHPYGIEARATVAVVCRKDWVVIDRLQLPVREVSDVVVVPRELAEGARRGFRTNPERASERDQLWMFDAVGVQPSRMWALGDPLTREDCRVKIEASIPESVVVGSAWEMDCQVTNLGRAFLVSAPPNPVNLSYKWLDCDGGRVPGQPEPLRSRLTWTLPPKGTQKYRILLRAPGRPGQYTLRIVLVQEQVAWFDDLFAEGFPSSKVWVVAGDAEQVPAATGHGI